MIDEISTDLLIAAFALTGVVITAVLSAKAAGRAPAVTRINALEDRLDQVREGLAECERREVECERRFNELAARQSALEVRLDQEQT